ncbi:glutamate 5-kinase [Pleionea sediminis]|uniref:glutamate 5-kinase n=1 Tax=Pleionea sediminis TaxID=2569479 RepID=UPI001185E9BD|nr:glutamate 5-kinase [Pleionea sediminis]
MDQSKFVIVKVGSQLVTDESHCAVRLIASHLDELLNHGYRVVLISSGAVAMGHRRLEDFHGSLGAGDLEQKAPPNASSKKKVDRYVAAAVGQDEVIRLWRTYLKHPLGQVLVDRAHLGNRHAFIHTQRLIEKMLALKVLPIINENDALNLNDRLLGNNDLLAAHISNMLGAPWLFLITEVGAIYQDYPANKKRMAEFDLSDESSQSVIADSISKTGTGGMASKLRAAEIAAHRATVTYVVDEMSSLLLTIQGRSNAGTRIMASRPQRTGQKLWLSESSQSKGTLYIDDGAKSAIVDGKGSLLLPGIVAIAGAFNAQEVVDIYCDNEHQLIAKGICRMSSEFIQRLINHSHSRKRIADKSIAGQDSIGEGPMRGVVVHRNQLVLITNRSNGEVPPAIVQ